MSEEILKALMQLFAIIAKQDEGVKKGEREFVSNFLVHQLSVDAVEEYLTSFDKMAGIDGDKEEQAGVEEDEKKKKRRLTSVKDSVRILGICKKINITLTQNQKVVVLVRLFELVNANKKFTEQRMAIINTVSEVFKIPREEYSCIESFILANAPEQIDDQNILIINDKEKNLGSCKHIKTEKLDASIFVLHISSVDLYFLKYTGNEDLFLNGLGISNRNIYLFANGSTVKLPKGKPVYYSDVVSRFMELHASEKISFKACNLYHRFPNGNTGLRNIDIFETHGRMVGIMGASGAGKTTLTDVLSGIETPSSGEVLINGIDLHRNKNKIEGVIGYIPQDDLLIEELTVFQNLYYNARLCFRDKSEEEIVGRVEKTLTSLGLSDRKDMKVGAPLKNIISGGQRKRLNIALELIREPSILFVDEPTSGLSSRDSENVMDLLRELALKGKLIFVVIHQPSSEIYKMFDRIIILDTGGYMVYYGNPVEAVMYFKKIDAQINSEVGECPACGNVNPELIFNILEAKVVDEFGNYTERRKVSPEKWEEHRRNQTLMEESYDFREEPARSLNIPGWIRQFRIYTVRDFLSKISNRQYVALNLLEAPLLGFILSYIIRYIADPNSSNYIFRENENIPPYIFMCIVVALFLGLTVSAEEIYRDRKILKREAFLNLSRSAYLFSKILILFMLSAIQSIMFVLVGNYILGIKGMYLEYFFALFSAAAFANLLGLNISASFNSAVTIYILIPLLMIPQMILGGAMFSFDKLNRTLGSVDKVPLIAEFMASKWIYEALMVHQYKANNFEKPFYDIEKHESQADFKKVWFLPKLTEKLNEVYGVIGDSLSTEDEKTVKENLALLRNELKNETNRVPDIAYNDIDRLYPGSLNNMVVYNTKEYIKQLDRYYGLVFQQANEKMERIINHLLSTNPGHYTELRNNYHNESVADIVKKVYEKNKILIYKDRLIQQVDPVYQDPDRSVYLSIRSHFFAPKKHFMGYLFETYWFNMLIVWLMTIILYFTLYFDLLKRALNLSHSRKVK
ncbi:MAG: ATP-binding cassette domain-containing protein [Bacteroidetes bacterium]|nr:ATP-binding cassette domain-containing protein [Bacteroidota bacterium]